MRITIVRLFFIGIMLVAAIGSSRAASRGADEPETVMITLRAKAGSEADLARVIADHWATAARLKLVLAAPHLTLQSKDRQGRTTFIDIFTWRDVEIPDNAPREIQAIWEAMTARVEPRDGRPGLEIAQMELVAK